MQSAIFFASVRVLHFLMFAGAGLAPLAAAYIAADLLARHIHDWAGLAFLLTCMAVGKRPMKRFIDDQARRLTDTYRLALRIVATFYAAVFALCVLGLVRVDLRTVVDGHEETLAVPCLPELLGFDTVYVWTMTVTLKTENAPRSGA